MGPLGGQDTRRGRKVLVARRAGRRRRRSRQGRGRLGCAMYGDGGDPWWVCSGRRRQCLLGRPSTVRGARSGAETGSRVIRAWQRDGRCRRLWISPVSARAYGASWISRRLRLAWGWCEQKQAPDGRGGRGTWRPMDLASCGRFAPVAHEFGTRLGLRAQFGLTAGNPPTQPAPPSATDLSANGTPPHRRQPAAFAAQSAPPGPHSAPGQPSVRRCLRRNLV